MAKYLVNKEDCIGCGLCAEIAPDVFRMDDGYAVAYAVDGAGAQEALESCPVAAIVKE